jgi:HSP20 family protein
MRVNWDPFYELIQMQDRTDRLLQDGFGRTALQGAHMPAVDVYEESGKLLTEVSLPNFDPKDIEVNLSDQGLEIKAQHMQEKDVDNRKYLMRETTQGSFYRFINMPAGAKTDQAKATFDKGILRVEIPVEKQHEPKKLEIKTSGPMSDKTSDNG